MVILESTRDFITKGLKYGRLVHKKVTRRVRSDVWKKFHSIHDKSTDEQLTRFFVCIDCNGLVHNNATNGNTNIFLRHKCTASDTNNNVTSAMVISNTDKDKLKTAVAKFVAKVPFTAKQRSNIF